MQHNPVVWFEIYVNDMPRAKSFYEGVLQIQLSKLAVPEDAGEIEMWSFPAQPHGQGAGGALAKVEGNGGGGSSTIVYFACDDCATEAGRVPSHGGTVLKDKFSIGPYGFVALVNDTEGNTIGLHSMK